MTMLSRSNHSSHRLERTLEPTNNHLAPDRSPLDHDDSGSISPPRKTISQKAREHDGDSQRRSYWSGADRQRDRNRDRSPDRDWGRRYDGNGPRVQIRNRDKGHDDNIGEHLSYENNSRKVDMTGQDRNRHADCYRAGRAQRDHNGYHHYESYRSNHNEVDPGSFRDRRERRDYRPIDQTGSLYPQDKHHHSSYDRQLDVRPGDYASRSRPQSQYYQSSSHLRRHHSPRAPPSPSKSPMRRPFKSHDVANDKDDRYIKRRRLDNRFDRHIQNRRSSRSRNHRTSLARSLTPSRSRSPTPSDYSRSRSLSKSHSRSRTRTRSNHRAKSRSCSHSTDPDYLPARSPSPIPPVPPRPPKSKLRPSSRSHESIVLSHKLRSSSRHSHHHSRRSRSFRKSRTPPSEISGSSLDGQPCDMTTRSRSSRRSRSHSRRRSISPSVISGYSRTPSQRRSASRSRSAHPSSDRRLSSSPRHHDRSRTRSPSCREPFSSPRSFRNSRSYGRRRAMEDDLGPPPRPPRPPVGHKFTAQDHSFDQRARDSDRLITQDSNQQKQHSPSPQPPSPPPPRPKPVFSSALDDTSKASQDYRDVENASTFNSVTPQAPLPASPPPAIPKPPRSPKRLRPAVHSIRKAPGMPPTAPVAQTSAGVRRFFPGDDENDEDELAAAPTEPTKPSTIALHPEEPELPAEPNPQPPSPSPPPLPPPPQSPLHPPQRTPSHVHLRQHVNGELSQTPPPPPPPSVPPPPPPPLSPFEATRATSTAVISQSLPYNSQPRVGYPKRQFWSRDHLPEGPYSHHWNTSSRKPFHRITSRWNVRDVLPDHPKGPMHPRIEEPGWETAPTVYPINSSMPQVASQPEAPSLANAMHYGNQLPGRSTCTDSAYHNPYALSVPSQVANQAVITHPQFPEAPQPPSSSAEPPTTVQTQVTQGRRETKEIYERLVQVGEGTYGKVYKARNIETGELVAMKRIRMEAEKDGFPITAIREIKLLQGLHHPNIVNLVEMVVSKGHVYIVFEYMDHDLSGVLHHPHIHFTEAHTKSLMYQLLSGLQYMHEREVLHRDLKGSNILLNKLGQLKIADFGLARRFERGKEPGKEGRGRGRDYTNRVITLWYKPPELLFGATVYGEEVDMWSAGAIFLELFTRRPILQTGDEIDQLCATFKLMGTPTEKNWPEAFDLPWFELFKPKTELPSRLRETFFGTDKHVKTEAGMFLAEKLLSLRPDDRPSAREALNFPYFTLESPKMELPKDLLSNVKGEWHELESKRARRRRDI